jgi:hypothetical protein
MKAAFIDQTDRESVEEGQLLAPFHALTNYAAADACDASSCCCCCCCCLSRCIRHSTAGHSVPNYSRCAVRICQLLSSAASCMHMDELQAMQQPLCRAKVVTEGPVKSTHIVVSKHHVALHACDVPLNDMQQQ